MDYTYYDVSTTTTDNPFAVLGAGFWVSSLAVTVFLIIAIWMIYEKAGQPGWAAIIPIYNIVVMLRVIKFEWWHILIMIFVPFASLVYSIIIPIKLAKVFGKSTGFAVLAVFLPIIAYPILAFGQATYQE